MPLPPTETPVNTVPGAVVTSPSGGAAPPPHIGPATRQGQPGTQEPPRVVWMYVSMSVESLATSGGTLFASPGSTTSLPASGSGSCSQLKQPLSSWPQAVIDSAMRMSPMGASRCISASHHDRDGAPDLVND